MSSIDHDELPSTRRLLRATGLAVAVAAALLVTVVLPAEYGIDPTGVGNALGLDVLGGGAEVAQAAELPGPATAADVGLDAVGQPAKPVEAGQVGKRDGAYRQETMSLTLAPGEGAEIKAPMTSGDALVFHWTASGEVAVDMHGERTGAAEGEYTSYWIERAQQQASGSFTAPFDGTHGWYWLNRGTEPVTVQVQVAGFQQDLYRP